MPIKFTKDSFIVEVYYNTPHESYVNTCNEIIEVLQQQDESFELKKRYYLLEMLREMMPNEDQAKLMLG